MLPDEDRITDLSELIEVFMRDTKFSCVYLCKAWKEEDVIDKWFMKVDYGNMMVVVPELSEDDPVVLMWRAQDRWDARSKDKPFLFDGREGEDMPDITGTAKPVVCEICGR